MAASIEFLVLGYLTNSVSGVVDEYHLDYSARDGRLTVSDYLVQLTTEGYDADIECDEDEVVIYPEPASDWADGGILLLDSTGAEMYDPDTWGSIGPWRSYNHILDDTRISIRTSHRQLRRSRL